MEKYLIITEVIEIPGRGRPETKTEIIEGISLADFKALKELRDRIKEELRGKQNHARTT